MTIHIIGAGLAGLSAAIDLAEHGLPVILHESTSHAGGRCRSWFNDKLGSLIDNGTHMLVGANHPVFDFLRKIGSITELEAMDDNFPIFDLVTGKKKNMTNLPVFFSIIAAIWHLGHCDDQATIQSSLGKSKQFSYFWDPLAIAIMNTPPSHASAKVFRNVVRRTIWTSKKASRPFMVKSGLSETFILPAIRHFTTLGGIIRFQHPLRKIEKIGSRAEKLLFNDEIISLLPQDKVIIAVPWSIASGFLPNLPDLPSSPIINCHFHITEEPDNFPDKSFVGLSGGVSQWLFRRGDILSVTISAAQKMIDMSSEEIARKVWPEVTQAIGKQQTSLPPNLVIKEKRATLFHSPEVEKMRPNPSYNENVILAGDWTATGLPCTIEAAIVSGNIAADIVKATG